MIKICRRSCVFEICSIMKILFKKLEIGRQSRQVMFKDYLSCWVKYFIESGKDLFLFLNVN